MIRSMTLITLALAWPLAAPAAAPTQDDLNKLNKSLNPTATPDTDGVDVHVRVPGQNIDQQGNRLVMSTPGTTKEERKRHLPLAKVTPTAAFVPAWTKQRALEERIFSAEKGKLISRAWALKLKERMELLNIKYGLKVHPDGSGLTDGQMKALVTELEKIEKTIFN